MSTTILLHHFGLGDHLICHGLVREYCSRYEKVALFAAPHNMATVRFMYRDIPHLQVIEGDKSFATQYIADNATAPAHSRYDEVNIIGFDNLDKHSGEPFELQFYRMAHVDFEKKWTSFFVERDRATEKKLYDRIITDKNYIFLHEDASRKYLVDRKQINPNLAICMPDPAVTQNAFDYCTIIEQASEIHVIDSSFMFLIDCLEYNNPHQKLYIHRYSRENAEWKLPILKKNWTIITDDTGRFEPIKNTLRRLHDSPSRLISRTPLRRMITKLFRTRGWIIEKPRQADVEGLLRRYAWKDPVTHITNTSLDEKSGQTQLPIVLYKDTLWTDQKAEERISKLCSITRDTLIINTPCSADRPWSSRSKGPRLVLSLLDASGFEPIETHVFSHEILIACRRSSIHHA